MGALKYTVLPAVTESVVVCEYEPPGIFVCGIVLVLYDAPLPKHSTLIAVTPVGTVQLPE
jgi:hypothetical protein